MAKKREVGTDGGSPGVVGQVVKQAKQVLEAAKETVQGRVTKARKQVAATGTTVAKRVRTAAKSAAATVSKVTGRQRPPTLRELRAQAAQHGIAGRSRMTREQLTDALAAAAARVPTAPRGTPDLAAPPHDPGPGVAPPTDAPAGSPAAAFRPPPEVTARKPKNPPKLPKPPLQKSGRTR